MYLIPVTHFLDDVPTSDVSKSVTSPPSSNCTFGCSRKKPIQIREKGEGRRGGSREARPPSPVPPCAPARGFLSARSADLGKGFGHWTGGREDKGYISLLSDSRPGRERTVYVYYSLTKFNYYPASKHSIFLSQDDWTPRNWNFQSSHSLWGVLGACNFATSGRPKH